MFTQLNPTIPVWCPKGKGFAIGVIDYSQEHNLIFVIAVDETGEIWSYSNKYVRMQGNITMERGYGYGREVYPESDQKAGGTA